MTKQQLTKTLTAFIPFSNTISNYYDTETNKQAKANIGSKQSLEKTFLKPLDFRQQSSVNIVTTDVYKLMSTIGKTISKTLSTIIMSPGAITYGTYTMFETKQLGSFMTGYNDFKASVSHQLGKLSPSMNATKATLTETLKQDYTLSDIDKEIIKYNRELKRIKESPNSHNINQLKDIAKQIITKNNHRTPNQEIKSTLSAIKTDPSFPPTIKQAIHEDMTATEIPDIQILQQTLDQLDEQIDKEDSEKESLQKQ